MKIRTAAVLLLAAAAFVPDMASAACSTCTIQSKKAVKGGKFEYKMSCIHDTSGDEIMSTVTAAKDSDAMKMAKGKCP
ncbi:MAG TPA: hypothetical protein VIG39_09745 [Rhizomicrobium sp.]|jgi:hypothetical protein